MLHKNLFKICAKISVDIFPKLCYNFIINKEREIKKMKVSPKCYIISLDTYKRISPYFNTYERAAAWKKKHHVFGIIVDIKKTLDKNKINMI
jgi:hypothetical protein